MDWFATPLAIKRLLYLFLVSAVAFGILYRIPNTQTMWVVWSSAGFALITTGNTFVIRVLHILVTSLIAMALVFLVTMTTGSLLLLAASLFFITSVSIYLTQRYPKYLFILFTINLFAILAGIMPATLSETMSRVIFIFIGGLIALIFQVIFLPYFKRNEIRGWQVITLRNLKKLSNEIFSCFLQPDYVENLYLFERRVHEQKIEFIAANNKLHELTRANKKSVAHEIKTNTLFDALMNCALLRRRVTDVTIFEVCHNELEGIAAAIDMVFNRIIQAHVTKAKSISTDILQSKIQQLEESYQHVLQVTSREPLVFLLFIQGLKGLCRELATYK